MGISRVHSHFSLPFPFLIVHRQTSLGISTTLYHYLNLLFLQVWSGSHFSTETAFIKVTDDLHVIKSKHVSEFSPAWPFTSFWDYWPLFFLFKNFYWSIVDLQCWFTIFCCIAKRICYTYIYTRITGEGNGNPVFLPGEFQGQRSLVGCCLWGRPESDTTEAT